MKKIYKLLSYVLLVIILFTFLPVINTEAASNKEITITTQKQLNNALDNAKISKITIKTTKNRNFTISKGDYHKDLVVYQSNVTLKNKGSFDNINVIVTNKNEYSKALKVYDVDTITFKTTSKSDLTLNGDNSKFKLIIDASKSSIINNSSWKSITIKNNLSWIENAQGNKFTITASKFNLTTNENAAVKKINLNKSGATLNVNANSTVESIIAKSNATINLSGSFEGQVLNSISKANEDSIVKVNSGSATYSVDSHDTVVQLKSNVNDTHVHDTGAWIEQTATTTRIGAKVRYCIECRAVLEIITTPMLTEDIPIIETPSHTHNYVVTSDIPATCSKIGVKTFTCNEDGKQYVEATPATGHDQGIWNEKIPATTTSTGTKVRVCTQCDAVLETATIPKLPQVHTHTYTSKITTEATCTKDGVITYACTNGDHTYTKSIPKIGHDQGIWVEKIAPTYNSTGTKIRVCTKCDAVLETSTIPKLLQVHTHTYTSKITTEATCTKDGIITYTCKDGDHTYTEVIPKTGHDEGKWYEQKATTTANGVKVRACTKCGAILESVAIPKLTEEIHTHSYTSTITTPVTCTNEGVTTYTCTAGDHTYTESIPKLSHISGDWEVINEPTTTNKGLKVQKCTVGGEILKTEEIPMLEVEDKEIVNGHELVIVTIDIGNGQTKEVKGYYDYDMAQEVYQKLNDLRISIELNTLNLSNSMSYAADVRAAELTVKFDHWRPNGEYCYYIHDDMSSENVAMGYTSSADAMVGWINSPSHYAAMIKADYTSVSISCFMYEALPGQYIGYWSMLFSKK